MSRITLITGGCRSGKSDYAVKLAQDAGHAPLFVATCVPGNDSEMVARVAVHRASRPAEWRVHEEGYDIAAVLQLAKETLVILDSLPTWIGNLLVRGDSDSDMAAASHALLQTANSARSADLIVVSAEVGAGLVPETALGRRFRDHVGEANKRFAQIAARVIMMVAGIPVDVKGSEVPC